MHLNKRNVLTFNNLKQNAIVCNLSYEPFYHRFDLTVAVRHKVS